ncbi:MAG: phytoene/squalene synthase family protein [Bacteroidetes bacterium]|nr:phytoene/squalene synthase family protein [Rhodothermia bacterium]MCX7905981.1 phytoene/squalene synthase family protein [Bacteroidota bacterium]MDW8285736.1 phytoene/squalene synthase family protein [Bacteroidota bacterium]
MTRSALAASYAICRAITREHARTFYFASHVLGPRLRRAAYAIYGFCRLADDVVDRAKLGADPRLVQEELEGFRRAVRALRKDTSSAEGHQPWFAALQDTVRSFGIPLQLFEELLDGVQMDVEKKRYETFQELYDYCYRVASVVGLMLCHVFGYRSPEALGRAVDMGVAMQLTNILRDIPEDYRLGRIYLPQEELEAYGYTEAELARGVVNEAFRALMAFEVERARAYYRRAWGGIPLLQSRQGRICTRIMSRLYAGILDEIERAGYDVFRRRAFVRLGRKVVLGAQAALKRPGWGIVGWSAWDFYGGLQLK